jgi:hypothetical protein
LGQEETLGLILASPSPLYTFNAVIKEAPRKRGIYSKLRPQKQS